jgi:hypothetical protein
MKKGFYNRIIADSTPSLLLGANNSKLEVLKVPSAFLGEGQ